MSKWPLRCRCGVRLPARKAENATYVLDGQPVCSFNCYIQYGFGPESDWDCPPVEHTQFVALAG